MTECKRCKDLALDLEIALEEVDEWRKYAKDETANSERNQKQLNLLNGVTCWASGCGAVLESYMRYPIPVVSGKPRYCDKHKNDLPKERIR